MSTLTAPNRTQIAAMVRDILVRQMDEDPRADTISSGIILPVIAEHGFSPEHEQLVEGEAEDIWGRYLRGDIADPVAAATPEAAA